MYEIILLSKSNMERYV